MANFPNASNSKIKLCIFSVSNDNKVIRIASIVKERLKSYISKGIIPDIDIIPIRIDMNKRGENNEYKLVVRNFQHIGNIKNLQCLIDPTSDELVTYIKRKNNSSELDLLNPNGGNYPSNDNDLINLLLQSIGQGINPIVVIEINARVNYTAIPKSGGLSEITCGNVNHNVYLVENVGVCRNQDTVDFIVDFIINNFSNNNSKFPVQISC